MGVQLLPHGLVQRFERLEYQIAQRSENPRVHDIDGPFHEGFVAGRVRPCREYDRPMVPRELGILLVDLALILVRLGHRALEAVAHDGSWDAAEEEERVPVRDDEVLLFLRAEGFHVGVLACPKDGYEDFRFVFHAVFAVATFRAGEVDVHPLAGLVLHDERDFGFRATPRTEMMTELRVLVAVGMLCFVFTPEDIPGDADPKKLREHPGEDRKRSGVAGIRFILGL